LVVLRFLLSYILDGFNDKVKFELLFTIVLLATDLGFVQRDSDSAFACTWQNSDAYCYRSLNTGNFTDAAVGQDGAASTGVFNNEPAGDVLFVQVECTPHFDLDHGEIYVMQLPWRSRQDARNAGRRQIEWCRNWPSVWNETGTTEDCPGNGLYIHKYIDGFYDDGIPIEFNGNVVERVEFNFNAGYQFTKDAVEFLNNYHQDLQSDENFTEEDWWSQLYINFSALQGVNFNADLWMPSGNFQLSESDHAIGDAWVYSNFDWGNYNDIAYNKLPTYAIQNFEKFGNATIE
jgi:hypothetical protein